MSTGPVAPSPSRVKEHLLEVKSTMPPRPKDAAFSPAPPVLENGFHGQSFPSSSANSMVSALPNSAVISNNVSVQSALQPSTSRAVTKAQRQKCKLRSPRLRACLQQRQLERRLSAILDRVSRLHSAGTVSSCRPVVQRATDLLVDTSPNRSLRDVLASVLESEQTSDTWLSRLLESSDCSFSSLTEQILRHHEHLDSDATDSDSDVSVASDVSDEGAAAADLSAAAEHSTTSRRVADPSHEWWRRRALLHSQAVWLRGRINQLDANMQLYSLLAEDVRQSRRSSYWNEYHSRVCQSASRCLSPPPALQQPRIDLVQLTGVARELRRQCGGSSLKCNCHPPLTPCVLCCGRLNRTSTFSSHRHLLTQPTAHPCLRGAPALAAYIVTAANKTRKRQPARDNPVSSRRKSAATVRRDSSEEDLSQSSLPRSVPVSSLAVNSESRIRSESMFVAPGTRVFHRRSSGNSARSSRSSAGPASPAPLRCNGTGVAAGDDSGDELGAHPSLERLAYAEIIVPAWRVTPVSVSDSRVGLYEETADGNLVLTRAKTLTEQEDLSDVNYMNRHRQLERMELQRNTGRKFLSPDPRYAVESVIVSTASSTSGYKLRNFPLSDFEMASLQQHH